MTLHVEGDDRRCRPGIDLSAYRIVQEGLTNALKHANGAHAERDRSLRSRTASRSRSSTTARRRTAPGRSAGDGLAGMRERVALYGGTLDAGPRAGGGFVVRAQLPVEARS